MITDAAITIFLQNVLNALKSTRLTTIIIMATTINYYVRSAYKVFLTSTNQN